MKLSELLDILVIEDPDMEVVVAFPANDYFERTLVKEIEYVEVDYVTYSDYHRQFKVSTNDKEFRQEVLILK